MATGKQIQKKGSFHFTPTPATGMFKPRPFAEPAQPETATPEVQTKVELGNTGGDRLAGMQVSAPAPIQPKLTIGAPGDKYEQEADTIARKVVRQISAPTPPDANPNGDNGFVQRQFSAPSIGRLVVQRREAIEGGEASSSLESTINQARSSGVPLVAPIRRQMEGAFGADFSGVRIHANNNADTLNRELSARAFTTGNNIFFKRGEYNPGSSAGKELLAHELTHVVQQGQASIQPKALKVTKPKTPDWVKPAITSASSQAVNIQAKTTLISPLEKKFVEGNKTNFINQNIETYNKIPLLDQDFNNQHKILLDIFNKGIEWLINNDEIATARFKAQESANFSDLDISDRSKKTQAIVETISQVQDEKEAVEEQRRKEGNSQFEAYNALYQAKEPKISETKFVDNMLKKFETANQANDFGTKTAEVKTAATTLANTAKAALTDTDQTLKTSDKEDSSGMVSEGLFGQLKLSAESVSNVLNSFTPIGKLIKYLYHAYASAKDMNIFKAGMSARFGSGEVGSAAEYSYRKSFRKFWTSALPSVCYSIIEVLGVFTGLLTGGLGLILNLAAGIIKSIDVLWRAGKGIWKYLTGQRGVNRQKNAKLFVDRAIDGDDNALTILVKLELFDLIYQTKRKPIWALKKLSVNTEQFPESSPNPENKRKMQYMLYNLKNSPKEYGYQSIEEFIQDEIVPHLQSFA